MTWLIGVIASVHAAPLRCGLTVVPSPPVGQLLPPPTGGTQRDTYGLPHRLQTAHFALRWGSIEPPRDWVDEVADALERAWDRFVTVDGFPAPDGTSEFLFNVYIADSGDGAPSSYGALGYYTLDGEGWPMVVLAPTDDVALGTNVAVHEFFHALQFATGRFALREPSAWFLEATAEWAAVALEPDNPYAGSNLYAYAAFPERPLGFFASAGGIEGLYAYGAFVVPFHLTQLTSPTIVRDTWLDPDDESDPIEVMKGVVERSGGDFNATFMEHVARNVTWDYGNPAWPEQVDQQTERFDIMVPLAQYARNGPRAPVVVTTRAPGHYGYNVISVEAPEDGVLTVNVVGEPMGEAGSPAGFGADVVVLRQGASSVSHVPFDEQQGTLTVELVDADAVWLTVGAWGTDGAPADPDERFPYNYTMEIAPATPSDPPLVVPETTDCGCQTSEGGLGASWLQALRRR